MSTTLLFHMDEKFLQAYADYLRHLKEEEPEKEFVVEISIGVVPDGISCDATKPHITIIGRDSFLV